MQLKSPLSQLNIGDLLLLGAFGTERQPKTMRSEIEKSTFSAGSLPNNFNR